MTYNETEFFRLVVEFKKRLPSAPISEIADASCMNAKDELSVSTGDDFFDLAISNFLSCIDDHLHG